MSAAPAVAACTLASCVLEMVDGPSAVLLSNRFGSSTEPAFRREKAPMLLEAVVDGARELLDRLVVAIRSGEQHHKESEKQGHEISE